MAGFERYDVVRVPFPFTDRQAETNRPALVICLAEKDQAKAQRAIRLFLP